MAKAKATSTPIESGSNPNLEQAGVLQYSALVTQVLRQASGNKALETVNASNFASVAHLVTENTLNPMDAIMGSISQVLSRTIFSIRPYRAKLLGLERTAMEYGGWTRKITEATEDEFTDDLGFELVSGSSVDMYQISLPKALEFRFDKIHPLQAKKTYTLDQLKQAMSNYNEMGRFMEMVATYMANQFEFESENLRRLLVGNTIAAKITADPGNVRHLITEYNAATGLSLDGQTVMQPDNFAPFFRWAASQILSTCQLMTEYSEIYHMNPTGYRIQRHTPLDLQRLYIANTEYNNIVSQVLSMTFHDGLVPLPQHELVSYWQNIQKPLSIDITPRYMNEAGQAVAATEAVQQGSVFAVLWDRDCMGYSIIDQNQLSTPVNAGGRYYNLWWNQTAQWRCDLTENCVVFLLD